MHRLVSGLESLERDGECIRIYLKKWIYVWIAFKGCISAHLAKKLEAKIDTIF